jgi:hypothetical protein
MFSAFSGVSMEIDSRKLYTLDDYRNALADTTAPRPAARFNLRAFFDGRQSYLMNHAEVKKVGLQ